MNALRQEAFRMVEAMPDEGLTALIEYMVEYNRQLAGREQRMMQRGQTFDNLMQLIDSAKERRIAKKKRALEGILKMAKSVPDFDEEKELMESREERFLYENNR